MSVFAASKYNIITTNELKAIYGGVSKDFVLIDALSPIEYKMSHIKGAINIPTSKFKENIASLPTDKNKKIITYCLGPRCNKSRIIAKKLMDKGYTNVWVYNEGLPSWMRNRLPIKNDIKVKKVKMPIVTTDRLKEIMAKESNDYFLLDLRVSKEYEKSRVSNDFVNIQMDDLYERYTEIPKNKKILLLCRKGKQSVTASWALNHFGYDQIEVYPIGFLGWLSKGNPIVKN